MSKEEKKGFFKKLGDALSNRDEKEAAQKAKAATEEAAAKAKAAAEEVKAEAEARIAEANKKRVEEAEKLKEAAEARIAELEAKRKEAEIAEANKKRMEEVEKLKEAAEARKAEFEARKQEAEELAAKNAVVAEHTVVDGDTLSGIALKYFKHATPPYYMHIYEANKDIIGANPNIIRPGMVLKITVLPDELKD